MLGLVRDHQIHQRHAFGLEAASDARGTAVFSENAANQGGRVIDLLVQRHGCHCSSLDSFAAGERFIAQQDLRLFQRCDHEVRRFRIVLRQIPIRRLGPKPTTPASPPVRARPAFPAAHARSPSPRIHDRRACVPAARPALCDRPAISFRRRAGSARSARRASRVRAGDRARPLSDRSRSTITGARIMPAPTVALVSGSIRITLPVARFCV